MVLFGSIIDPCSWNFKCPLSGVSWRWFLLYLNSEKRFIRMPKKTCTVRGKCCIFQSWKSHSLVDRSKCPILREKTSLLMFSSKSFRDLATTLFTWDKLRHSFEFVFFMVRRCFKWSPPKTYHQHLSWGWLMVYQVWIEFGLWLSQSQYDQISQVQIAYYG